MKLNKWSYTSHKYIETELPEGNYKPYGEDMDEIVNCPHCHKELRYGTTYTSMEFHTSFGFGYGVCSECYDDEWARRRTSEGTEYNDDYQ